MGELTLVVAVLVALVVIIWRMEGLRTPQNEPAEPSVSVIQPSELEDWDRRIRRLEETVEGLPSLWDAVYERAVTERESAHRFKERARKHQERADEIMAEIEGELEQQPGAPVHGGDGSGSGESELPDVRGDLVDDQPTRSETDEALLAMGWPFV